MDFNLKIIFFVTNLSIILTIISGCALDNREEKTPAAVQCSSGLECYSIGKRYFNNEKSPEWRDYFIASCYKGHSPACSQVGIAFEDSTKGESMAEKLYSIGCERDENLNSCISLIHFYLKKGQIENAKSSFIEFCHKENEEKCSDFVYSKFYRDQFIKFLPDSCKGGHSYSCRLYESIIKND
ncbi:MAG: hypothetical protein CL677_06040 [Bdellovibrionaceae bacterium]|nr:hypothetical protein [Pseudobdellovibrionaceae bacterium]|tara:strand:- start:157118 stop:157666 length:549 start_codon:yes stop_codon:yes gene_type:complete